MKQEEIDKQAKIEGERIYPGMTANQQQQRDAFINGFCNGAKAMQLYSDQQNKEKDAEIQRLTKEVEELKGYNKTMWEAGERKNEELTRLRELLERAGSMMSTVKHLEVLEVIDKDKYDQILSEINALNHKP